MDRGGWEQCMTIKIWGIFACESSCYCTDWRAHTLSDARPRQRICEKKRRALLLAAQTGLHTAHKYPPPRLYLEANCASGLTLNAVAWPFRLRDGEREIPCHVVPAEAKSSNDLKPRLEAMHLKAASKNSTTPPPRRSPLWGKRTGMHKSYLRLPVVREGRHYREAIWASAKMYGAKEKGGCTAGLFGRCARIERSLPAAHEAAFSFPPR